MDFLVFCDISILSLCALYKATRYCARDPNRGAMYFVASRRGCLLLRRRTQKVCVVVLPWKEIIDDKNASLYNKISPPLVPLLPPPPSFQVPSSKLDSKENKGRPFHLYKSKSFLRAMSFLRALVKETCIQPSMLSARQCKEKVA